MKKHLWLFIVVLLSVPVVSGQAEEFGNVAIYLDKSITENFSRMSIQLQGEPMVRYFDKKREMIFWDIYPGRYDVQLAFPDDRGVVSTKVDVYPGLTSRMDIESKEGHYFLKTNGFADQSGHILTFNRKEINRFPGELSDGIGILSRIGRDSVRYSYEGLNIDEKTMGRNFTSDSKTMPDLALINISDPFAGYNHEDISLINNYLGPEKMGGDYTYGTRDQRYYRVVARHELPRGIGSAFGSLSYDNLADADPKWNVDGRLPHNGAENVELLGGVGFNILTRFKSDLNVFYKSIKRDYYVHAFYFDIEHAPREELNTYGGDLSVNGWLMKDLFMNVGVGISGDEAKSGDGVFFDDLAAYKRTISNPFSDPPHYLFYAWDDMYGITDTLDESHYYEIYSRDQNREKRAFLQLKKQFSNQAEIWSDVRYSASTYRKYLNYDVTGGYESYRMDVIGFDSLGDETTDNNYFADIPRPKKLNITLGGKMVSQAYFLKGAIDYYGFDPGALVFRDPSRPFDPDGEDDYELDVEDMKEADVKSEVGFRFSCGLSINKFLHVFGNASQTYDYPDNHALYGGYAFFENRYWRDLYYVYSNADLDLIKTTQLELGVRFTMLEHNVSLSFRRGILSDIYGYDYVEALPSAYSTLGTYDAEGTENALVFSYQYSGNHFISAAAYAQFARQGLEWISFFDKYYVINLGWTEPDGKHGPSINFDTYSLAGTIGLHPENLKGLDRERLWDKILARLDLNVSFEYRSGLRYTRVLPYAEVSMANMIFSAPVSSYLADKAKDFFQVNLALSAHLANFRGASMSLGFEVLNLFDRENVLDVYKTTGQPDKDAYIGTAEYENRAEDDNIYDSSGLTFAEKYALRLDDPKNYSRPRMFRVIARLEF